ncbi:MAG: hypothetical protein KDI29_11075, partial [Pseudomonadales bacterium]|nr:hypothetical protein [Pseudomonadales bacterium]
MKTGHFARLALGIAMLSPIAGFVHAQDSFIVAGPITSYQDGMVSDFSGFTFTATISYDSAAVPDPTKSTAGLKSVFQGAVQSIEYTVRDGEGLEVHHMIAEGNSAGTQSSFIEISAGTTDRLRYEASSLLSTENSILGGQARIIFTSQAGILFDGLDTVPQPPAQGDYDSAV